MNLFFDGYPGRYHGSKDGTLSPTRDAAGFMQFAVAPTSGNTITYTSLSYSLLLQDAVNSIYRGPRHWELRYSTDGFASVDIFLAVHDLSALYTGSAQLKQVPFAFDLSALGILSDTVTFRWYGYDTMGSSAGSFAGVSNSANGATWGGFSWSGVGGNITLDVNVTTLVTFDGNGGSTPVPVTKSVTAGSPYGALATVSRSGYLFDGWYDAATGGTQITTATLVSSPFDHSLYAHWVDITPPLNAFSRQNPATSPTNADELVFRATFNEDVQNVDAVDFAVNGTTTAGVSLVTPGQRQRL